MGRFLRIRRDDVKNDIYRLAVMAPYSDQGYDGIRRGVC